MRRLMVRKKGGRRSGRRPKKGGSRILLPLSKLDK